MEEGTDGVVLLQATDAYGTEEMEAATKVPCAAGQCALAKGADIAIIGDLVDDVLFDFQSQ